MKDLKLQDKEESLLQVAKLFLASSSAISPATPRLQVEVREDKCFGDEKYLSLGEIILHPEPESDPSIYIQNIVSALQYGFYEWHVPSAEQLLSQALELMQPLAKGKLLDEVTICGALKAIPHILVRTGLAHPVLDAGEVSNMPFLRPCTIIADTSAVLQGALDFVLRFLHPQARIKIPAIVHMEVIVFVERYLARRFKSPINPSKTLLDHVKSQGAQRVLLRLELQAPVEVERPRLGADPLRGIVQPDSDAEDKNLGLSVIQRSFADRLILETAIQQRERLGAGHTVAVLTADQGLARMALAEGIPPIFFQALDETKYLGKKYLGTCYFPFRASVDPLYSVPLLAPLWELAVTFGEVRLRDPRSGSFVSVVAMGNDTIWYPFHSRDDLLWVEAGSLNKNDLGGGIEQNDNSEGASVSNTQEEESRASLGIYPRKRIDAREKLLGSYEAWPSQAVRLLTHLAENRKITDSMALKLLSLRSDRAYRDYRNFFCSGRLADRDGAALYARDETYSLWTAMKTRDYEALYSLLGQVPSFKRFVESLRAHGRLTLGNRTEVSASAFPAYRAWAEIIGIGLGIPELGVVFTPLNPFINDFIVKALAVFEMLAGPDPYVLTGRWLEKLAEKEGVHPIRARERLQEAQSAALIQRFVEGSTPENRYERHSMFLLDVIEGKPEIRQVNLYDGSFLIPGKASVRIRLEGRQA